MTTVLTDEAEALAERALEIYDTLYAPAGMRAAAAMNEIRAMTVVIRSMLATHGLPQDFREELVRAIAPPTTNDEYPYCH